jgi:hypothetical protein
MPDTSVLTDAEGLASFLSLEADEYDLTVDLDYFVPHDGLFTSGEVIALEPIPVVQGRVLSAARVAVVGAMVTSMGRTVTSTQSKADGRYQLPMARLGRIVAEKDGALGVSASTEDAAPGSTADFDIVLGDGAKGSARTLQRSGAPLPGVEVNVTLGAIRIHQTTGTDGVFAAPNLEEVYLEAEFSKPGYVTVHESYYPTRELEDVVLSRPGQLDGQLVDAHGKPVAQALVLVQEPFSPERRLDPVTTDAQGRFSFHELDFPSITLRAYANEQSAEETFALPEGETTTATLMLRPALTPVELDVVTAAGITVRDFEVVASPVPPAGWTSRAKPYAGLELTRGRFRFQIVTGDGRSADETLDVDPKPGMAPLRFVVRGDGGLEYEDELPPTTVKVRVLSSSGAPVSGAQVECYSARGLTREDGVFECVVQAGPNVWPLHVVAKKGADTGLARATGTEAEVQVTLRASRTIRGRVEGVLPPSGLWLTLNSAESIDEVELTGSSFTLENRAAVRTFVCVVNRNPGGNGYVPQMGCAVSEGDGELVIPVGAPGTLSFSAVDDRAAPIDDPIVYVDRVRQRGSASKGVVQLEVPPGTHVLVLNREHSRARYEAVFSIRSGQVTELGALKLQ